MKIIDLLNKIANGEEVPKKIKYNDKIWRLASDGTYFIGSDYSYDFWLEHGDDKFEDEPITLNDEVEIIEEPQENKIPDKIDQWDRKWHYTYYKKEQLNQIQDNIEQLRQKYNKIIDYLEEIK